MKKTLNEEWEGFRASVLFTVSSPSVVRMMNIAFWAGMTAMYVSLLESEGDPEVIESHRLEIQNHMDGMMANMNGVSLKVQ